MSHADHPQQCPITALPLLVDSDPHHLRLLTLDRRVDLTMSYLRSRIKFALKHQPPACSATPTGPWIESDIRIWWQRALQPDPSRAFWSVLDESNVRGLLQVLERDGSMSCVFVHCSDSFGGEGRCYGGVAAMGGQGTLAAAERQDAAEDKSKGRAFSSGTSAALGGFEDKGGRFGAVGDPVSPSGASASGAAASEVSSSATLVGRGDAQTGRGGEGRRSTMDIAGAVE